MTCGMLCLMRRERRGVLHLDKYSPPKAKLVWWEEERKREKRKEKKKREKKKKRKKKDNGKENREPVVLSFTNIRVAAVNGSTLQEVGVLSYSG